MKSKIFKILIILLIFSGIGVYFFANNEKKEFSYHWSCHKENDEESDYYTYASMYVDAHYDSVDFNISTEFEGKEIILYILDSNNNVVYEKSYDKSGDYTMKMKDLEKDEFYTVKVQGISVKNIHFEIHSFQNE